MTELEKALLACLKEMDNESLSDMGRQTLSGLCERLLQRVQQFSQTEDFKRELDSCLNQFKTSNTGE